MINLDGIEGLTDAQKTAINAAHDADVKGLKKNLDEAVTQRKADQKAATEAEQKRVEAEEKAKIEAATKDKDFEALQAAIAERDARIETQKQEFTAAQNSAILDRQVNDFIRDNVPKNDPAAREWISKQFRQGLKVSEDGKAVPATAGVTIDQYIESVKGNKENARYILGSAGAGGGAAGNPGGGGAAPNLKDLPAVERLKIANKQT